MAMSETTAEPLAPTAPLAPAHQQAATDARAAIVRSLHAVDPQTGSGTPLRDECIDCGVEVRGIHTTLHMAARPDADGGGMGPLCVTCWQMRANAPEPEPETPDAETPDAETPDAETPRERRRRREPSG